MRSCGLPPMSIAFARPPFFALVTRHERVQQKCHADPFTKARGCVTNHAGEWEARSPVGHCRPARRRTAKSLLVRELGPHRALELRWPPGPPSGAPTATLPSSACVGNAPAPLSADRDEVGELVGGEIKDLFVRNPHPHGHAHPAPLGPRGLRPLCELVVGLIEPASVHRRCRQCDISTGTVMCRSRVRVAPPRTTSRRRVCP